MLKLHALCLETEFFDSPHCQLMLWSLLFLQLPVLRGHLKSFVYNKSWEE